MIMKKRVIACATLIFFIMLMISASFALPDFKIYVKSDFKIPSSIKYIFMAVALITASVSGSVALVLLTLITVIALIFIFGFNFTIYLQVVIPQNIFLGIAILATIPLLFITKILTPERVKLKKKSLIAELVRRFMNYMTVGMPHKSS